MPYQTETTPFTGDNNMEDFMTNVYVPFARDDVNWSDNQAPTRDGAAEVIAPEFEVALHRVARVGSPGADVSPFTPQPPYVFFRSDDTGDHMHIFTSFGIDYTGSPPQEPFDQPNNPMNCPQSSDYSLPARVSAARCILMNDLVGTFQKYWLFADTAGRYLHCVLKLSSRHYRHFHVGLLTALHPDLSDDAFYVTGQWWDQLDPSGKSVLQSSNSLSVNGEHNPYSSDHLYPFGNRDTGNELDSSSSIRMQLQGNIMYMPGLAENSPEIVWYKCSAGDEFTYQELFGTAVRKHIGDVNANNDDVIFGVGHITGYGGGLGAILFNADRTFTSNAVPLIPIYVAANVNFASLNRAGVAAQIPDVFRINMANISAEEEITVGSDTYVCFPLINKDSANVLAGEGYSGYEGLAYKKITAAIDG